MARSNYITDIHSPKKPRSKTKVKGPRLTKEERAEVSRVNGRKSKDTFKSMPYKEVPLVKLPKEDTTFDYLADIYDKRAAIASEIKLGAVQAYIVTGTLAGVQRLTGLRKETVGEWKNHAQWWPIVYEKMKKEKQEELDATLTDLIAKTFDQVLDRVEHGDEVLNREGDLIRKKMSGKDLATTAAIMYDKRAMLRGDPTSITAKASPQEMLKTLKEEFTAIAKQELDKTVVNKE